MAALFVLLPGDDAERDAAALLDGTKLRGRIYAAATSRAHLLSQVRDARDPLATTWVAGLVKSVALGAILGAVTNGILAGAFDLLGGLLELALPLGFAVGAFLGGFAAAMTGTHRARQQLRALLEHFVAPMSLLQLRVDDADQVALLRERCTAAGMAFSVCG